jgi:hypothetical protein
VIWDILDGIRRMDERGDRGRGALLALGILLILILERAGSCKQANASSALGSIYLSTSYDETCSLFLGLILCTTFPRRVRIVEIQIPTALHHQTFHHTSHSFLPELSRPLIQHPKKQVSVHRNSGIDSKVP